MSRQPTRSRIRAFLPVEPPQIIAVLSQDNVKAGARTMSASGTKRTFALVAIKSAFDPKRTLRNAQTGWIGLAASLQ